MPSAIASIVSRVQALRFAWRSHVTTRADPSSLTVTVVRPTAPLRSLEVCQVAGGCANSISSPRAVRYTTRVFCSPTGSVPGATACTSKRAPSSVRSAVSTPSIPSAVSTIDAQRRDDRVAVGHHRVAPEPVEASQHGADRPGVHVDRLHAQHVVDATLDADPHAAAPAGAGRRPHAREVARAVAQQRRGLAAQVGPHELAEGVVLERQRRAGPGLDELEDRPPVGGQVQPLARLALAGHGRPHVAHPEAVGHRGAPGGSRSARAPRPGPRRARPR